MLGVAIAFYVFKMKEEAENTGHRRSTQPMSSRPQSSVRTQSTARVQSNVKPQTLTKPQTTGRTSEQLKPRQTVQTTIKTPVQAKTQMPMQTQEQKSKLSWKAKNFLEDNDEFEFGFLDFDDDDE